MFDGHVVAGERRGLQLAFNGVQQACFASGAHLPHVVSHDVEYQLCGVQLGTVSGKVLQRLHTTPCGFFNGREVLFGERCLGVVDAGIVQYDGVALWKATQECLKFIRLHTSLQKLILRRMTGRYVQQ
jgi:hypothetical protein